ncbi:MAG: helix-turn-helix domain-containing protein [Clostridiales bacterium]|nr:helix-turn-helix domain-containing protein [Clostridiales bacterium]
MTLGEKLARARKEKNITQEQLADKLGVSRQSISKWESDITYPETDKLIRMSELFDCSLDYLLKDSVTEKENKPQASYVPEVAIAHHGFYLSKIFNYEYKSKRTVRGIPLVHINFVRGKTAKGIVAIGFKSIGVVSIGLLSLGLLSFGLLALGFLGLGILGIGFFGFGSFALGFFSGGAISIGIISFGAISIGVMSCGAISIGQFAVGALAKGHYFAFGDNATAMVAIGATKADGTLYTHFTGIQNDFSGYDASTVFAILKEAVPSALKWLMNMALSIAGVK